ncbi:MAG: mycothiol system anti-sigma-R factor [Solirubrobacterales bacterium]
MNDECRQVLEQVELYLDGELGSDLRARIDEHLEKCPPCMDHSDFQRHLKELLRAKCGCDQVPEDLFERIRARYAAPNA